MDKQLALQKVAALCASGEKCKFDIIKKLCTFKLEEDDIEDILETLCTDKFIDEQRYAIAFVKDKFRYNGWGRKKIAYALFEKRIPENFINNALEEIDEETYLEALSYLLEKKRKTTKESDSYKLKAKLYRFALSRGFEPENVNKVLGRIGLQA